MKTTDPRRIHVAVWTLPNGEEARVTVAYPTFGPRGYTLHVQPIERRTHEDGYVTEVYTPSRGYRMHLEDAARYSRRRLEALAEDPAVRDLARGMFDRCAMECAPLT
jgi:hypothetical protein